MYQHSSQYNIAILRIQMITLWIKIKQKLRRKSAKSFFAIDKYIEHTDWDNK